MSIRSFRESKLEQTSPIKTIIIPKGFGSVNVSNLEIQRSVSAAEATKRQREKTAAPALVHCTKGDDSFDGDRQIYTTIQSGDEYLIGYLRHNV